jgi:DnaJ-class molecular chaperone
MNRPVLKLPTDIQRISRINCDECHGRGYIRQWPHGHEERTHMGRCEQCSGLGKVRA